VVTPWPGGRSTSPNRRQGKPIESIALKITFRADKETTARVKEAVPSAVVRGRVCEVKLEAREPGEMAQKTKDLLERIRRAG